MLELKAGASDSEIHAAYRLMVKVWHPDRFPGDEPLRHAAEAKLKEINSAFQFLNSSASHASAESRSPSADSYRPQTSGAESYRRTAAESWEASRVYQQAAQEQSQTARPPHPPPAEPASPPPAPPRQSAAPPRPPSVRRRVVVRSSQLGSGWWRWLALAVALLAARYVWIAFDIPEGSRDDTDRTQDSSDGDLWQVFNLPKQRFLAAVKKDIRTLGLEKIELPAPIAALAQKEPNPVRRANAEWPGNKPERSAASGQDSFITVGTTRDQVLRLLGNPSRASQNVFVYGESQLYFRGDNVVGWRIDPASGPMHVKLWPRSFVDPEQSVFKVGSSKDEVLAIQGTPTALTEDKFEYGQSEVYFRAERVAGWKNDLMSIPLHVDK